MPTTPNIPPAPSTPSVAPITRQAVPEPEDMFAGAEPATPQSAPVQANVPSRIAPHLEEARQAPTIPAEYLRDEKHFPWKGIVIAVGVVVILGGVGYAAYLYRDLFFSGSTVTPSENVLPIGEGDAPLLPESDPVPPAGTPAPEEPPAPTQPDPFADDDGDGLTNEQEFQRGTDPTRYDTDGDGLFDGEEVNTYTTDPLNSDTDGDGFLDAAEVLNGYNPKGAGRLFNVPQE